MEVTPLVDGYMEVHLDSFEQFPELIVREHLNNSTFIYRGQADASWRVMSKIDRHEKAHPKTVIHASRHFKASMSPHPPARRDEHLEAFKVACRGIYGGPNDLSKREWWSLAQHHGLATPLLDWTLSPFVALFFAFEESYLVRTTRSGRRVAYEPKQRAVYCALAHLIANPDRKRGNGIPVFVPRRSVTRRLSSQVSVLMEMPPKVDLAKHVVRTYRGESAGSHEHPGERSILTKIVIPSTDRIGCLKMLERMNVNRLTLFGDLEGAAHYVNNLWEQNSDTPLAWLPDAERHAVDPIFAWTDMRCRDVARKFVLPE
jgi:hypothetical protein